jgi:hypothetical protein
MWPLPWCLNLGYLRARVDPLNQHFREKRRNMHKMKTAVAMLAFVLLGATMMYAQATRTWVSGVGDDANPCSRTAPCKTWAGAISKTAAGGEIDALDPGGFGALTITKAITLDGGGGQVASVLVSGTNGIVVQAGPADVVILRNLRINGISGSGAGGLNGIRFLAGAELDVENCYVFGFTQNGLDIALNQNTSASVHVSNSVFKNIADTGIRATNAQSPAVQVSIDSTYVQLDNIGIEAAQHSRVVVTRSSAESGGSDGMRADDAATGDAQLNVSQSQANYHLNGINAQTGSTVIVGDSTVVFNAVCSLSNSGGTFLSYASGTNGTNRTTGSTCGAITSKSQQ